MQAQSSRSATKAQRLSRRIYWQPFTNGFYRSIGEASEALAAAVKSAIAERTAIAERPMYFISGGADSRVMLFSTEDRGKVTGVNIYEHAREETEIARDPVRGCRHQIRRPAA